MTESTITGSSRIGAIACSVGMVQFVNAGPEPPTHLEPWDYTPASLPVSTPSHDPSLLVACLNLWNPGDYLGRDLTVASPWTMIGGDLETGSAGKYIRGLSGVATLPYAGGTIPDVEFAWEGDYYRSGRNWIAVAAVQTAETSPVQVATAFRDIANGPVTFADPPTEGNMLLLVATGFVGVNPSVPPPVWKAVYEHWWYDPQWAAEMNISFYARCVGPDESADVPMGTMLSSSGRIYVLSEWALTGPGVVIRNHTVVMAEMAGSR